MAKLLRSLLVAAAIFVGIAPAQATDFGDIVVTVDPTPPGGRSHGYAEYRIVVTNRASQRAHQVGLTLPGNNYYGGNGLDNVARMVTVQPASTVVVFLWVPVLPMYGEGLGVTIDGGLQAEIVDVNLPQRGEARSCLLLSQNVGKQSFEPLVTAQFKSKTGVPEISTLSSTVPSTDWSPNWLGYSSFDAVVVTGDEMRTMPAEVASALIHYAECGGALTILGAWEVPKSWSLKFGQAGGNQEQGGFVTHSAGFGACVRTALSPKDLSSAQWLYLKSVWDESKIPWELPSRTYDQAAANRVFPVVENLTVPVRGLFLLMFLFVVVIGPLNLFVLSRKKKKIWLLWTIPAISLVTCVAVSVYSILSEGWGGKARTAGFTILDEASHRATTIGWTAFYSPLTPGEGLRYSYETELTPVGDFGYRYGGRSNFRTIDWTQDQRLARGWVAARVPSHLMVRRSELRRERITLNKEPDGSLSAVNGLGVDVRELWLADVDGKIYRAMNLPAGASTRLTPTPGEAKIRTDELHKTYQGDWYAPAKLAERPTELLTRGSYIAMLNSSPFIEEGMPAASKRAESVVYGIMARE